jgi:hypothetical protein
MKNTRDDVETGKANLDNAIKVSLAPLEVEPLAMSDTPSPFERAAAELRKLGITLRRLPGEYQVNLIGGPDENALAAETLDEAVELGRSIAAAPAPAGPPQGKRGRRPLRMTPKAIRRRRIKAHNYRLRARALRKR